MGWSGPPQRRAGVGPASWRRAQMCGRDRSQAEHREATPRASREAKRPPGPTGRPGAASRGNHAPASATRACQQRPRPGMRSPNRTRRPANTHRPPRQTERAGPRSEARAGPIGRRMGPRLWSPRELSVDVRAGPQNRRAGLTPVPIRPCEGPEWVLRNARSESVRRRSQCSGRASRGRYPGSAIPSRRRGSSPPRMGLRPRSARRAA